LDDRQLVAVRLEPGKRPLDLLRHRGLGLDEPVSDHEVARLLTEVGAEARRPALELVQGAREAVVAGLGELELLPAPVRDFHVLDRLSDGPALAVARLM